MLNNNEFPEWLTFYHNESDKLQAHFDAGGTIAMLEGTHFLAGRINKGSLYNCCNEDALGKYYKIFFLKFTCLDCLPIMMINGAKPDNIIWDLALNVNRTEHVEAFLYHGFLPPKSIPLKYFEKKRCAATLEALTKFLCRKSVFYILCYSKTQPQPWYYLWVRIAELLYETRFEKIWLDVLPENE